MHSGMRMLVAGVVALAGAVPTAILTTATPAAAQPTGYVELVVELFPFSTDDAGTQQQSGCQVAGVDLATGVTSPLGSPDIDSCVEDLALAPDGSLYGIQQQCEGEPCVFDGLGIEGFGDANAEQLGVEVHLIQFDLTTGAPTDLGAIGGEATTTPIPFLTTPFGFGGLTFDKDGNLFVEMVGIDDECDFSAFCLYRVDLADLANPTFLGTGEEETFLEILAAGCGTPEAVTLEAEQFGIGSEPSTQAFPSSDAILTARDLTNGATTPIGGTGVDNGITGMAFDSDGTLWGVGFQFQQAAPPTQNVFTINTTTGLATPTVALDQDVVDGVFVFGLALPLDCPEELVVAFTG